VSARRRRFAGRNSLDVFDMIFLVLVLLKRLAICAAAYTSRHSAQRLAAGSAKRI
jgi:hypothetical protein